MAKSGLKSAGLTLALALILATPGCRRTLSQDYVQAAAQFDALRVRLGAEAVLDPQIAQVETLLQRVPKGSLSYGSAQALQKRIDDDRAELTRAKEARETSMREALKPPDVQFSSLPRREEPAPTPPADVPDAGSAQPVAGMPLGELSQRFSGCFTTGAPLNVMGKGKLETWVLKDITNCRDRHPGFAERLILVENGKILTAVDRATARAQTIPDGGAPKPR